MNDELNVSEAMEVVVEYNMAVVTHSATRRGEDTIAIYDVAICHHGAANLFSFSKASEVVAFFRVHRYLFLRTRLKYPKMGGYWVYLLTIHMYLQHLCSK